MATVRYFCTYFDKNYLSRALCLIESLRAHHPRFHLFVFCMDDEARDYLLQRALPDVTPIGRADLESHDPELLATRPTRSLVEYYFTATPCCMRYVFDRFGEPDILTYVDADLFFFASSEPAFDELADASIAIVAHRFPPSLRHLEQWGLYNVGWLSFRRDEQGLACVAWWRQRCLEWCFDRLDGDRFADQKYLDQWPRLFNRTVVLKHTGVNAAPWNLGHARVEADGEGVVINGERLICFHFHGFKRVAGPLYESGLRQYQVKLDATLRRAIFEPYLARLAKHEAELAKSGMSSRSVSRGYGRARWRGLDQQVSRLISIARMLWSRSYLVDRYSLAGGKGKLAQ